MGHLSVERALQRGLWAAPDLETEFVHLDPWSLAQRVAAAPWPGLHRYSLDAHMLRWHLVEGFRGRAFTDRRLRESGADLLHLNSHAAAFGLRRNVPPYFVNVDATVEQWAAFPTERSQGRKTAEHLVLARRLEKRTFSRAAGVIAMSHWAAMGVRDVSPEVDTRVIHPGLDIEKFTPRQDRPAADDQVVRVLFVGGRFKEKGGATLLTAMQDLLGAGFELDVVTTSNIRPQPGLRQHRLTGGDPRLVKLYQNADVFCLPTSRDSVPWVILEAFACGVPAIASDIGAIPEMLGPDGERGALLPRNDVQHVRAALEEVAQHRDEWRRRGAVARRYVEAEYDPAAQGLKLLAFMRSAL